MLSHFYILKSFCYTWLIPLINHLVVPLVTLVVNTRPTEQVKWRMSIFTVVKRPASRPTSKSEPTQPGRILRPRQVMSRSKWENVLNTSRSVSQMWRIKPSQLAQRRFQIRSATLAMPLKLAVKIFTTRLIPLGIRIDLLLWL